MFSKFSSKCFYFYYSPRQKHGVLNSVQKIRELNFSSLIAILILFSLFYITSSSVTDFGVSAIWWFKGLRSFFWFGVLSTQLLPAASFPGSFAGSSKPSGCARAGVTASTCWGCRRARESKQPAGGLLRTRLSCCGSVPFLLHPAAQHGARASSVPLLSPSTAAPQTLAPLLPKEQRPQKYRQGGLGISLGEESPRAKHKIKKNKK